MRASAYLRFPRTPAVTLGGLKKRVAVIGAGPAGFYAAQKLLSLPDSQGLKIDMFEELPTPFGLVRYGVAPDHPEVKNCEHKFERTAADSRFRFLGNLKVGLQESSSLTPAIPIEALQPHYDAVLLSYGASHDRSLNIPGEAALKNIFSARSFVHFYNGYPLPQTSWPDLSKVSDVTIVGQGNVALDCARMLLSPVDTLAKTDTPDSVLAELSRSRVKRVSLVGRRGALQFAGTTKELREMMQLPGVTFTTGPQDLQQAENVMQEHETKIKNARMKKRLLGLMKQGSEAMVGDKEWSLDFLKSPISFQGNGKVEAVDWELNQLMDEPDQDPTSWRVQGTNKTTQTTTDMVLTSIGYRSIAIQGVPFDAKAGIIRNDRGRVISEGGAQIPGLYTSGWVARGPTGVLTSTMMDAFITAELIASDLSSPERVEDEELPPLDLNEWVKGYRLVSWQDWQVIDQEERRLGALRGKEREKFTSLSKMLELLS